MTAFTNKVLAAAGKVKAAILWLRGLDSEQRRTIYALLILAALFVFCMTRAFADNYPSPASPIPQALLNTHGWNLETQEFDAVTGEKIGSPKVLHLYDKVTDCNKAQMGHVAKVKNRGTKWVGKFWFCHHAGPTAAQEQPGSI